MKKIAVCGKGGVGKSFLVYALAKVLEKRGKRVLVVDSDESNQSLSKLFGFSEPASFFLDFLGGKKAVKKSLMERFRSGETPAVLNLIEKDTFKTDEIPEEFIKRKGNIAILSIGKIKEPLEGCVCPMGIVSKEFLQKIDLKEEEVIFLDTEAGVEHFGRGIEKGIDTVIAVAEPYLEAADEMVERIYGGVCI